MPSKKEKKRLRKAKKASPSTTLSTANLAAARTISPKRIERFKAMILAKYQKRWNEMLEAIHISYERFDIPEIEEKAAELFDDIASIHREEWKRCMGSQELCLDLLSVYPNHLEVFTMRGLARYGSGENLDGAIADCTESVNSYKECTICKSCMSGKTNQVQLLMTRGSCHREKGEADKAILDFRAAWALRNALQAEGLWDDAYSKGHVYETLLAYGASKKGLPRPHYTGNDRRVIEKMMGINLYTKERRHCDYCGKAEGNDGVELRLCPGCDLTWFCGRDCQVKAWKKEGHKPGKKCMQTSPMAYLRDEEKEYVENGFESGVSVLSDLLSVGDHPDECASLVILRDPDTGRLFDSLTDRDVYFLPSELHLVPDEWKSGAEQVNVHFALNNMRV